MSDFDCYSAHCRAGDCEHFLLRYLAYIVLALVFTGLQYPFHRNTYHMMRYTILYGSL